MNRFGFRVAVNLFALVVLASPSFCAIRGDSDETDQLSPVLSKDDPEARMARESDATDEPSADLISTDEASAPTPPVKRVKTSQRKDRADAFVAGPDWEF